LNGTQDESGSGKRRSMSIDFIEQFLRQEQQGRLAALLLGKLDAFNRIATTFGRERCETFCAEHAEKLRDILPPRTPIIRLSERRFAVLIDCDSMGSILDYAAALTEDHPPEIEVGGDKLFVDVTLGIAVYPSHADDAETLFRRAELALTEARDKELSFDIYRPDSTQQQAALWKFESDLQGAVQRRELEVYFQPKVAIDTRRVCGVEALVRWRTPSGAFVPASDFIPMAERTGTIVAITWQVFDHVIARVAEWGGIEKPFSIAVNVSPPILTHSEFTARIKTLKAALDARGFGLTIEITEDSLVQGDESALQGVEKLRKLGVDFALDDFGKGYSSLGYLKQLPATEIKIDKRFIGTIAVDATDRQIVKTVVQLAHVLGMRVVAEGIDNAEALDIVAELGCQMAQGFFIARPMRGDLVQAWIDRYLSSASSVSLRIADAWPAAAAPV
jgi:EAL domain-containing protein (putative c-di-GMP-specific phosphodiesterase class I)/GGDEF domain-containing protein